MKPTDKQIHYIVWKLDKQLAVVERDGANMQRRDFENWLAENIDIGTASDIIKDLQHPDEELGMQAVRGQLKHLGFNNFKN